MKHVGHADGERRCPIHDVGHNALKRFSFAFFTRANFSGITGIEIESNAMSDSIGPLALSEQLQRDCSL